MVARLTGELGHSLNYPILLAIHPGKVAIANIESLQQLRREDLEFGLQDA